MSEQTPETLAVGPYTLRAPCPECGQVVHFPVELDVRLAVDTTGGKLRPVLRTKATEHSCGEQGAIPLFGGGAAS